MKNHVSFSVTFPTLYKRPVTCDRILKQVLTSVYNFALFWFTRYDNASILTQPYRYSSEFYHGAYTSSGIKTRYTCTASSTLFYKCPLRNELNIYLSIQNLPLKFEVATYEATDDPVNLSVLNHKAQSEVVSAAFIA